MDAAEAIWRAAGAAGAVGSPAGISSLDYPAAPATTTLYEATRDSAHAASYAAKTTDDPVLEGEWQQLCLAAYLLGEPLPSKSDRTGSEAARLCERLDAGELTQTQVTLAAQLGCLNARRLYPDSERVAWSSHEARQAVLEELTTLLGEALLVRVAADWAEHVLPVWESEHASDARPRDAIATARAWVECPCEEHKSAAKEAADTAMAAAEEGELGAADAASAASCAADAAGAESASAGVASTASYAYDAVRFALSEREWQRLRLTDYVLGNELEPASRWLPVDGRLFDAHEDRYDDIHE